MLQNHSVVDTDYNIWHVLKCLFLLPFILKSLHRQCAGYLSAGQADVCVMLRSDCLFLTVIHLLEVSWLYHLIRLSVMRFGVRDLRWYKQRGNERLKRRGWRKGEMGGGEGGEGNWQWNNQHLYDRPLRHSIGVLCEREPFINISIKIWSWLLLCLLTTGLHRK